MPTNLRWFPVACLIVLGLTGLSVAQSEERYWALFRDGSEVGGNSVADWIDPAKTPSISKKPLFDPRNPVRLLRDNALSAKRTGPRIYFDNGDVLPGKAVAYQAADEVKLSAVTLMVQLAAPFVGAGNEAPAVPVRLDRVQRIVLTEEPVGEYQPQSLILADGRRLTVRGMRWTAEGLKVLAADQVLTLTFKDIAEIHLPAGNTLAAVLAEGSSPCPTSDSLVGRWRTTNGADLTFRQDMMRIEQRRIGRTNRFLYVHMIQPTWALTSFGLPLDEIVARSFREPTEIPLSLLPAQTLAQKSFTGYLWTWNRNWSVRGDMLETGRASADLGVGTHSFMQVAFDLPPTARDFSTIVGIARDMGAGGCVKCRVLPNSPDQTALWQSGLLRGSDGAQRVGPLSLPTGTKRLVLEVDFAHEGRQPGDDPMDLRDQVEWIMPVVRVDRSILPQSQKQWSSWLPALAGWTVGPDPAVAGNLGAQWDDNRKRWEPVLHMPAPGYTLSRRITVNNPNASLVIVTARGDGGTTGGTSAGAPGSTTPGTPSGTVSGGGEVRVNIGNEASPAATLNIQTAPAGQDLTGRCSLKPWVGQTVEVIIKVIPARDGGKPVGLAWRRLEVENNAPPVKPAP